jgi:hypothetical protein
MQKLRKQAAFGGSVSVHALVCFTACFLQTPENTIAAIQYVFRILSVSYFAQKRRQTSRLYNFMRRPQGPASHA